jgi:hypothetical protein
MLDRVGHVLTRAINAASTALENFRVRAQFLLGFSHPRGLRFHQKEQIKNLLLPFCYPTPKYRAGEDVTR